MSKLACITTLLLVSLATTTASDSPPVYEKLQSYDFPVGLLPQGATGYELDVNTGNFRVYLNGTCSFSVQGYSLRYGSTISGTISRDRIRRIQGIQVNILLFWINIIEVSLSNNGDQVEFSVGIASASFGVDGFNESPQCGCGFDCVNVKRRSSGGLFGRLLVAGAFDR